MLILNKKDMALNKIDGKQRVKRSTIIGDVPSLGPSTDFTDGSWSSNSMIYPGEFFLNIAVGVDPRLWVGTSSGVTEIDLFSTGTTAFDFCATGLKTSAISGCSPVTIYTQFQTSGSTATGTTAFAWGTNNSADGNNSFIGGGTANSATTVYSSAVGGQLNLAAGNHSGVIGGLQNKATSSYSSIVGGRNNTVNFAYSSVIAGGKYNTIISNDDSLFIGGGGFNSVTKAYSSIVAGKNNVVSGNNSFIGGGYLNTATTAYSTIIGGQSNLASGNKSAVIGGSGNTVSGARSVVIGGSEINGLSADTVYVPNLNIQLDKGISFGTGATRTFVEIEIGDWNMDSTPTLVIPHGLSGTEYKTVRQISASIRNDADTIVYTLPYDNGSPTNITSTTFVLFNIVGGFFDSTSFDSTSYNRGFITFWYTPD